MRFTKKENIKNGQTYIILTEEECSKNNCYIDKKEYYKNRSMAHKIIGDDVNYIADISKIKNLD